MAQLIFVNLPVKELARSREFFTSIGYSFNEQFTDETATCMVISDTIYAMLLTESRFKEFTSKDVADARKVTEAIIALSAESREDVDQIVARALAAGGRRYRDPEDHGWMYSDSFEDPDGHQWEYVWMSPEAANGAPQ